MMRRRYIRALAAGMAAILLFGGCTTQKQEAPLQEATESAALEPAPVSAPSAQPVPAPEPQTEPAAEPLTGEIKPATEHTAQANAEVYELLDFDDAQEEKFAQRGCLLTPDELVIKAEDGTVVWSQADYDFIRNAEAPDTANPSLWRNARLNALHGLFEVVDGIYQVRGYDMSNISFVRGDTGWIVFDTGSTPETAKAAVELFEQQFGKVKISAVVVSHAHVDHYGGIGGVISQEELADPSLPLEQQAASGKTLVIVPNGYEKAVMEENVFAGAAMKRRAVLQYASYLEKGPHGGLSVGIGLTSANAAASYLPPTFVVTEPVFEATVDGVELVFQLTPGTESPAEMNTWLPQYKALWMAENCTGTLHNLYTLRGAEVRDGNAWAQYILEAKTLFGREAEVVFQSHNWPHWGNEVLNRYMEDTAAVYKFITLQTLTYINEGYTATEIANMIQLPTELEKIWYTRQYYGTLKHNAKAVYQKYMGWYDANPVHLNELEPSAYAVKLMEYLGDTGAVLSRARADFEKGEYQWVAQLTNMVVFAEPDNQDARYLCADALEQLGYQAESGAWRNAYLTAAFELRHGVGTYPALTVSGTGATARGMSTDTMLDYLGIRLDSKALENEDLYINLEINKEGKYLLHLHHGVLLHSREDWRDDAAATIRMGRMGILGIASGSREILEASGVKVEGREDIVDLLIGGLAEFTPNFNIVEP